MACHARPREQTYKNDLNRFFYLQERLLGQLLVHFGPVGDVLGPVGVVKRRERLLQVGGSRRDGGDDGRLRPPAQGILEQPRQLRLPFSTKK